MGKIGRPKGSLTKHRAIFNVQPKMKHLVAVWLKAGPGERLTRQSMAEAIGASPTTVGNWFHDPDFCEWFEKETNRHVSLQLTLVWQAMYDKAVGGNVPAAKLFVERFDKDYKPVVKTEADVTHLLPELSELEQDQLAAARQNFDRLVEGLNPELPAINQDGPPIESRLLQYTG